MAVSLALYANTPYPDALAMPVTDAASFFASKAWSEKRKADEGKMKMLSAILSSNNEQIRAIGIVAKTIAKKP